ncbi:hypothetical protein HGM15179_001341 [Zosterops borbonicus]|uniref:Uncharacterized protein n=1 Tax=Zosterops borbonicus TaxID=364589 RepID=A0A8K1GUP7_9PASS|nr:hypothetical protein HGM15179_001341 [Zosterops borbonicus]
MGGFCEKIPEANQMSRKVNASQLQDGPATVQSPEVHRWPMEETHTGASFMRPCKRPVLGQAPGRDLRPKDRGAHTGAGSLVGLVTPWETHAEAAYA